MLGELSELGTFAVAGFSARFAWREWRHRTGHWLYIPPPDVGSQNPSNPAFWVYPPVETKGGYLLVVSGRLRNVGPSTAYSVRVYAQNEASIEEAGNALREVSQSVSAATRVDGETLFRALAKSYRNHDAYDPTLGVEDSLPFTVISHYSHSDPFIKAILAEEAQRGSSKSLSWTVDNKQAHPVSAESRVVGGRKLKFSPNDLCAPYEET